jgi:hypothetical protein
MKLERWQEAMDILDLADGCDMNGIVDPFTDGIKVKYPDIMFYF